MRRYAVGCGVENYSASILPAFSLYVTGPMLDAMTAAGVVVATMLGVVVSMILWMIESIARVIIWTFRRRSEPASMTEREVLLSVRPVSIDVSVAPAKNPLQNGKVVRRGDPGR